MGRRCARRRMPPGEMNPFIMLASGVGQLYSPDLVDGPFPEHYEPVESPVQNPFSTMQSSPCAQVWQSTEFDRYGTPDAFPIVATTYRVSEHWQTGAMSRNMPWLVGLMPRVRRNRHGARQARRDQERRPGEQRARLHRGLRACHRTLPTLLYRGSDDRRDRPAVALGLCGDRARRHRQ